MPIINRSYYAASEQGRQDAQAEQINALRQRAMQSDLEQENYLRGIMRDPNSTPEQFARAGRSDIANSIQNLQPDRAAQAKEFATQMTYAAKYGLQSPNPKAFIEKNFPFLVETYGPDWANATDDQVRAELQGAAARFGVQAGIAPEQPKPPGELVAYMGTNGPVYGTREQALGQRPYDKPPQVIQQFTPVQTDVGVGAFNSRTGQVTPTGAKAPPKAAQQTEADKKAQVLFASMANAEKDIAGLNTSDTSSIGQAILGSNRVTAPMQSDDFRKYEAAGLRWAANLLYLKSGATATPDEIRSTWKQFFPQPGDGEDVKAQKAASRQQEMSAVAGAYNIDTSKFGAPAAPAPAATPKPAPQAALEYLKAHPEAKAAFKAKYGYLP